MRNIIVLPLIISIFVLGSCGEVLTGCKDGDPLLFFSPVRDFACPEEPADAVNSVNIVAPNEDTPNQVTLEWNNPAQIDLHAIEVRWNAVTDSVSESHTIPSVEGAIDTQETPNGVVRIPNARPNARMQQSFTVRAGLAYRFRIASVDGHNNVSLVQQTQYITAPTNIDAHFVMGADTPQVRVTWEEITGASGYNVYRSAGNNGMYGATLLVTPEEPITETVYIDMDVLEEESRSYRYSIRAVITNDAGEELVESQNSEIRTAHAPTAVAVPSNITVIPRSRAVTLQWARVTDAIKYRIYRTPAWRADLTYVEVDATDDMRQTYTDSMGLADNTIYRYRISAVSVSDSEGGRSADFAALTAPPPPARDAFSARFENGVVRLRWQLSVGAGTYRIYRAEGLVTSSDTATRLTTVPEVLSPITFMYTDSDVTNGADYSYFVRSVGTDRSINSVDVESGDSHVEQVTVGPATPQNLRVAANNLQIDLTWNAVSGTTAFRVYRTPNWGGGATFREVTAVEGMEPTYTDRDVRLGILYQYRVQAVNGAIEGTESMAAGITLVVDSDNDTLIDIHNLDMLNNIRHNLSGRSYKASAGASGLQCTDSGNVRCTGYELMRDLDFTEAGSYANGSVNTDWQPTGGSPGSATNRGWEPIGSSNSASFATLFQGNGYKISNLYTRNATSAVDGRIGLFGRINTSGSVRNLALENGVAYGGSGNDYVGIVIGQSLGSVINVAVRGGSVHGEGGTDAVGGLIGRSGGEVVASFSTAEVHGGTGTSDAVGGLIGEMERGNVIATYASGVVDGGLGDTDKIGGLIGDNSGLIFASYAHGNVRSSGGRSDSVGGLVGNQGSTGGTRASYATGDADGAMGAMASVGSLIGANQSPSISSSYGFGAVVGNTVLSGSGAPINTSSGGLPTGVTLPTQLTIPGSAVRTAAPAEWNQATSNTLNAWDFGTDTQIPALHYANYDGTSSDYCFFFSAHIPGTTGTATETDIECGTTLLSGQETLRMLRPFNLTTSIGINGAAVSPGASLTITATVRNAPRTATSNEATLTYYRSTNAMVDVNNDTPLSGTSSVPKLLGGGHSTRTKAITAPATAGRYYYYACVSSPSGESNSEDNCSEPVAIQVFTTVDSDGDRLIDISNLDMLHNIRHNHAGTSYKASNGDSGLRCGTTLAPTNCMGYELTSDLDFADAADYASGSINMEWRPTSAGSVVAPGRATNTGWIPIGLGPGALSTRFEGNGNTISNLYVRNTMNYPNAFGGLFGELHASGSVRNLMIEDSNVYGGSMSDNTGIAVGSNNGTLANVIIRGGSVRGGGGTDNVGGLVGLSSGTIVASSSTANVYGDNNEDLGALSGDNVGGLVGSVSASGTLIATYSSGSVNGGAGNSDRVGGLVGRNEGDIYASYATGAVSGTSGNENEVGGLVGNHAMGGNISASYAAGDVAGGIGSGDYVARLAGRNSSVIIASYGFGTISGGENLPAAGNNMPSNGDPWPSGVSSARNLTGANVPPAWNNASQNTEGAWSLDGNVAPTLRYADYNGSSSPNYCTFFTGGAAPNTNSPLCTNRTPLP